MSYCNNTNKPRECQGGYRWGGGTTYIRFLVVDISSEAKLLLREFSEVVGTGGCGRGCIGRVLGIGEGGGGSGGWTYRG